MCLGRPGRVLAIPHSDKRVGIVEMGPGERREVNLTVLAPTPEAAEALVGGHVMVHLGFATQVLSEEEARDSQSLLEDLLQVHLQMQEEL